MIGQSQSGTGKTAAFVLTMLTRIDITIQDPQVFIAAKRSGSMYSSFARISTADYGCSKGNGQIHQNNI